MPAKPLTINLIGMSDLEHTPWGRLVAWATTYGRYIMITTEIVVLLAFISRFSLDRKNTDLTEELNQKQAILEANASFERDIKSLQAHLTAVKTLVANQSKLIELIEFIESVLPADVYLTSLELSEHKLALTASASTTQGFAQFLANITAGKTIENVLLGDIRKTNVSGIDFQLTADVKTTTKK